MSRNPFGGLMQLQRETMKTLLTKFYGYFILKALICWAGYTATVLQGEPSQTLLIVGGLSFLMSPVFYLIGE
jgi:hypothetical protein